MRSLSCFSYCGKARPRKNHIYGLNEEENLEKSLPNTASQYRYESCSSIETGFLTIVRDKDCNNDMNSNVGHNTNNEFLASCLLSFGDSQYAITVARVSIFTVLGVCRIINVCFNFPSKCLRNCRGIDHRIDVYIRKHLKDSERNLS